MALANNSCSNTLSSQYVVLKPLIRPVNKETIAEALTDTIDTSSLLCQPAIVNESTYLCTLSRRRGQAPELQAGGKRCTPSAFSSIEVRIARPRPRHSLYGVVEC